MPHHGHRGGGCRRAGGRPVSLAVHSSVQLHRRWPLIPSAAPLARRRAIPPRPNAIHPPTAPRSLERATLTPLPTCPAPLARGSATGGREAWLGPALGAGAAAREPPK